MLHEYAVDPACFSEWNIFIRLIEQFGVPHGRLISQFPRAWTRMVHEACKDCFSFRQRQIMGDKLAKIRKYTLVRSGRPYDGGKSWKANAIEQQQDGKPFHAIITDTNDDGLSFVLVAQEILDETQGWHVARELPTPRTLEALSSAVAPLLRMSKRIVFVDKKFDPAIDRWQQMLVKLVEISCDGRTEPPALEYHVQLDPQTKMTEADFEGYCNKSLANLLPPGTELQICRLEYKPLGEKMHARYILTENGGIRIDWGLDTGKEGETTDVGLMGFELWEARWNDHQETSGVFEHIDKVTVRGRR